jgi:hypothetical protein
VVRRGRVTGVRLVPLDYESLLRRRVSAPVARFITAKEHPIREFDIFVRPVYEGWDYYVPPDADEVIGLWDQNADAYARWERGGQQEFVMLYHDDPQHTVVAWTEQGLLAELARQYFEFLNWHDEAADRLRYDRFAEYIAFRHSAELFAYLAVESHATTDFHGEFRSLFGRLA